MRVLKFGVVGFANTVVDYLCLNLLMFGAGVPMGIANVMSYSLGCANSWFWNRRWTFSDRTFTSRRTALPAFFAVNLIGLGLNTATVLGLVALVNGMSLAEGIADPLIVNAAKTIAVVVSYAWNYLASSRFVFRAS